MNNNALRNIDIDRLSSVTYFSAAHNQLEFVQLESCECLQYLNLSHNQTKGRNLCRWSRTGDA
ncbi:hypothetical protein N5T35_20995 [Escherichia coli]|nr:hypothetical protein [Escherichia coli]MCW3252841.1 hypothetical protein [Escherichia coli]